jgi:hypothetical protein
MYQLDHQDRYRHVESTCGDWCLSDVPDNSWADKDPVMEQFSSTWSPTEMETRAGEMYGPDGTAEEKCFN